MTFINDSIQKLKQEIVQLEELALFYPNVDKDSSWGNYYSNTLLEINNYTFYGAHSNTYSYVIFYHDLVTKYSKYRISSLNKFNLIKLNKKNVFKIDIDNYQLLTTDPKITKKIRNKIHDDIVNYILNTIYCHNKYIVLPDCLARLPDSLKDQVLNNLLLK